MRKKIIHLGSSTSGYFMFMEPGVEGNFSSGMRTFDGALRENRLIHKGCEKDAGTFGAPDGWKFVVPSEFL